MQLLRPYRGKTVETQKQRMEVTKQHRLSPESSGQTHCYIQVKTLFVHCRIKWLNRNRGGGRLVHTSTAFISRSSRDSISPPIASQGSQCAASLPLPPKHLWWSPGSLPCSRYTQCLRVFTTLCIQLLSESSQHPCEVGRTPSHLGKEPEPSSCERLCEAVQVAGLDVWSSGRTLRLLPATSLPLIFLAYFSVYFVRTSRVLFPFCGTSSIRFS